MQQVVLFSIDFSKESADRLSNDLKKVEEVVESNDQLTAEELFIAHFNTPYDFLKIDILEPPRVIRDIIERYKGLILGLPEEWFFAKDRLDLHIMQRDIRIEGKPSSFLLMPKEGTPVRVIVNENYVNSTLITVCFITNINYGNAESVAAFEQSCDEKLVKIQSNINLLNAEIARFNETYRTEMMKKISAEMGRKSESEKIAS